MGELSIPSVIVIDPLEMPSHSLEKYPLLFSSLEGLLWSLEISLLLPRNDKFLSKSFPAQRAPGSAKTAAGVEEGEGDP